MSLTIKSQLAACSFLTGDLAGPTLTSAEAEHLVDAVQLSGKSSGGKIVINREANGVREVCC